MRNEMSVMVALKHTFQEMCYAIEEGVPAKQKKRIDDDIVFRNKDANGVKVSTLDPIVITVVIGPVIVHKVLVDYGKSVNIFFQQTFDKTRLDENDL